MVFAIAVYGSEGIDIDDFDQIGPDAFTSAAGRPIVRIARDPEGVKAVVAGHRPNQGTRSAGEAATAKSGRDPIPDMAGVKMDIGRVDQAQIEPAGDLLGAMWKNIKAISRR